MQDEIHNRRVWWGIGLPAVRQCNHSRVTGSNNNYQLLLEFTIVKEMVNRKHKSLGVEIWNSLWKSMVV